MAGKWPRTMTAGRLKGQRFESESDYQLALRVSAGSLDDPPRRQSSPAKAETIRYTKAMVEAVLKMLEGAASMVLPVLRPDALPITEQEHNWLVQDWFDFGKRNVWFQRLLCQVFGVDTYAKLAVDHLIVIGGRVVATSTNPRVQAMALPMNLAFVIRSAMDAEAGTTLEDLLGGEPETPPEPTVDPNGFVPEMENLNV